MNPIRAVAEGKLLEIGYRPSWKISERTTNLSSPPPPPMATRRLTKYSKIKNLEIILTYCDYYYRSHRGA